jgi:hypothetical protein
MPPSVNAVMLSPRTGGVWRHLDGWRICDASAGAVAAPHPACLPGWGQP